MNPTPTDADALNRELELRLWNDDLTAKTEEQKRDCLSGSGYLSDRCVVRVEWFPDPIAIADPCPSDWWSALWNRRDGKPWQTHIESYVYWHRRPPRNFLTGDGMLLVIEEMESKGMRLAMSPIYFHGNGLRIYFLIDEAHKIGETIDLWVPYAKAIPETVAKCALSALAALSEVNHAK